MNSMQISHTIDLDSVLAGMINYDLIKASSILLFYMQVEIPGRIVHVSTVNSLKYYRSFGD